MIIKIMLIIFAYLLIGCAVLEIILWHDRKADLTDTWLSDPKDEVEQNLTAILWPFIIPELFIRILVIVIEFMFKEIGILIKGIRVIFTTLVYVIAAIIDKPSKKLSVPKGWIRCKDKPPTENNYYLVYEKIEDDSKIICVEEYKDGEWLNLDPGQEVIAWMPSPEGYKTEKEK